MTITVNKLTALLSDIFNDVIIINAFPYCRNGFIKYRFVPLMLKQLINIYWSKLMKCHCNEKTFRKQTSLKVFNKIIVRTYS